MLHLRASGTTLSSLGREEEGWEMETTKQNTRSFLLSASVNPFPCTMSCLITPAEGLDQACYLSNIPVAASSTPGALGSLGMVVGGRRRACPRDLKGSSGCARLMTHLTFILNHPTKLSAHVPRNSHSEAMQAASSISRGERGVCMASAWLGNWRQPLPVTSFRDSSFPAAD